MVWVSATVSKEFPTNGSAEVDHLRRELTRLRDQPPLI